MTWTSNQMCDDERWFECKGQEDLFSERTELTLKDPAKDQAKTVSVRRLTEGGSTPVDNDTNPTWLIPSAPPVSRNTTMPTSTNHNNNSWYPLALCISRHGAQSGLPRGWGLSPIIHYQCGGLETCGLANQKYGEGVLVLNESHLGSALIDIHILVKPYVIYT